VTAKNDKPSLIVVSGPTASGKSAFAVNLAREINAEIVNIDSVQIYKELKIGAAKLSEEEMKGVPHHLIGVLSPAETCNVATYCRLAQNSISEIHARGKNVILVGGTTMYITCLLQGLDDLPDTDKNLRYELESLSNEELIERLKKHDPESLENISGRDKVRLVRALEAFLLSGKAASLSRKEHSLQNNPDYKALILVLCREREELYLRINERAVFMIEQGLIEETEKLILKYGKDIPALKSLGYSQVVEYLDGKIKKEELAGTIAMFTRRFAKRQLTYWRNEPKKKGWQIGTSEFNKNAEELYPEIWNALKNPLESSLVLYIRAGSL
jgi:tRNA dimethylallyltransferase